MNGQFCEACILPCFQRHYDVSIMRHTMVGSQAELGSRPSMVFPQFLKTRISLMHFYGNGRESRPRFRVIQYVNRRAQSSGICDRVYFGKYFLNSKFKYS